MGGSMGKSKKSVLIVGLDNSGKTTLINGLKPKKEVLEDITATVGYQIEQFTKFKIKFTVFDMSGQQKYRDLWEKYYDTAQAIIFVVDSSDKLRIPVAKYELELLQDHPAISGKTIPLLFFANKMDVEMAMDEAEVSRELKLDNITTSPWNIFASNALTGYGVEPGMKWLSEKIKEIK